MNKYKTEQENFWAGEFGNEYIDRNKGNEYAASNTALLSRILARTRSVSSVIEFGSNIGMNMIALERLLPYAKLSAIEINQKAVEHLKKLKGVKIYPGSIIEFQPDETRDFVLIKGVLIHSNPDELPKIYQNLYAASHRYICIIEYYNPSPVEVPYRGHMGRLFKRDFAGEMMDKYKDLKLIDYGFVYHRDPNFPQDDVNWFLLEKEKQ